MGLREKMNQNPAIAGGITGGVLLLALIWIFMSMGGSTTEAPPPKDFYTVDDGATWFVDDAFPAKVVPFTKDGKQAYRVLLWTCDGGQNKFVSAVQRFSTQAKTTLQGLVDAKNLADPRIGQVAETWAGTEVKAPKTGDSGWVPYDAPQAATLTFPSCPPGKMLERLSPTE